MCFWLTRLLFDDNWFTMEICRHVAFDSFISLPASDDDRRCTGEVNIILGNYPMNVDIVLQHL